MGPVAGHGQARHIGLDLAEGVEFCQAASHIDRVGRGGVALQHVQVVPDLIADALQQRPGHVGGGGPQAHVQKAAEGTGVPVRSASALEIGQSDAAVAAGRNSLHGGIPGGQVLTVPQGPPCPVVEGSAGKHAGFQHIFSRQGVGPADHVSAQVFRHPVDELEHIGACPGGDLHGPWAAQAVAQGGALLVPSGADQRNAGC